MFGDALGRRVKSVQDAWVDARDKAELGDFHLADLRHEAASRFDEAGVPIVYGSSLLGHSNLSTTSRYLNIHSRGLHLAMQKLEDSRAAEPTSEPQTDQAPHDQETVAHLLHTADQPAQAIVQGLPPSVASKVTIQ